MQDKLKKIKDKTKEILYELPPGLPAIVGTILMSLISNSHDFSNYEKVSGVGATLITSYLSWDALDKLQKTAKYKIPESVEKTEPNYSWDYNNT